MWYQLRGGIWWNSSDGLHLPRLDDNEESKINDDATNNDVLDILKSHFMVNNRVYRVSGVGNDSVCVVPVDEGSETSLNILSNHANDLVDEYNL